MKFIVIPLVISFKKEISIVLGVLAVLVSLPIMAVVVVVGGGVSAASDALVKVDPISHTVDVFDADGNTVISLTAATTWPVGGIVTAEFGTPHFPYQTFHTGIDIADPKGGIGKIVTPFMSGTVSEVVNSDNKYGRYVFVNHGHDIVSQYWHLSDASATKGQKVNPGDVIGKLGSTGLSTGPHLHFEIQVSGVPVNPRHFMLSDPPNGLDL